MVQNRILTSFLWLGAVTLSAGQAYGSYGSSGSATTTTAPSTTTTAAPANNSAADATNLNYLLTLENLQSTFYTKGLQNFSVAQFNDAGFTPQVYTILTEIRDYKAAHASTLRSNILALGSNAVPPCTYLFPVTDIPSFLKTARLLEEVAVSAYLGALTTFSNPNFITITGAILSNDARSSAFLNYISGKTPAANAFDTPFGQAIVSLASGFVQSCPFPLPRGFPALTISPTSGTPGTTIALTYSGATQGVWCGFFAGLSSAFVAVANGACAVPGGLQGDLLVAITNASNAASFSAATTIAGPAIFVIPDKADA